MADAWIVAVRTHPATRRSWRATLPAVTLLAAGFYVISLLAAPLLDPGRNVVTAHPEDYAAGPFGVLVNVSYIALAVALTGFIASVMPVRGWSIAIPVLAIPAALMCVALAFDPVTVARGGQWWLFPVIGLAFVPLVSVVTLRGRLGRRAGVLTALGALAVAGLAALLVAPDAVGGIVNRAFDLLVGTWLIVAAQPLGRTRGIA